MKTKKTLFAALFVVLMAMLFCFPVSASAKTASTPKLKWKNITTDRYGAVVMYKGQTKTFKVKVPKAYANKKVKWSVSNKRVAKISKKGKLTTKAFGTIYVTAKVKGLAPISLKVLVLNKEDSRYARSLYDKSHPNYWS